MTTTFVIDTDNNITAFVALEDALNYRVGSTEGTFSTDKELAKLTSQWPIGRFVETWNSFAGVPPFGDLKPVKKFTDRKTAVGRIWRAIQALTPTPAQHAAEAAPKKAKAAKDTTPTDGAKPAREGSKKAIVLDMLHRPEGATLADIMTATGWQAPQRPGFHLRRADQEDGAGSRIAEDVRRRPRLPDQGVTATSFLTHRRSHGRRFLCSGSPLRMC